MSPQGPSLQGVQRLEAANARAVMERVVETGLIERGAVAVISVDAIRERSGDRWAKRSADVSAYVARKCIEHLSIHDLHHRLSDTDFLVATTSENGAATQAAALRILEEVLTHFLGAAETPDVRIKMVTDFSETGEIACAPVDPRKIARAPIVRDEAGSPYRDAIDPVEEAKRNPFRFVTVSGKALQIDFAVEPVASLRHHVTAALRITPTVTQMATRTVIPARAFGRLEADDLASIDRATIAFGSLFLGGVRAPSHPALILPVSFHTMATRKGRAFLAEAAGDRPEAMRSSVMAEFVDVDRGTPGARLVEVGGLVSSLCRGVLVRLRPAKDLLAPVRGYRPHGLTIAADDVGEDAAHIAAWLMTLGAEGKGAAPALMAFGLPNDGFFEPARVAGLTHASVRPEPAKAKTAA